MDEIREMTKDRVQTWSRGVYIYLLLLTLLFAFPLVKPPLFFLTLFFFYVYVCRTYRKLEPDGGLYRLCEPWPYCFLQHRRVYNGCPDESFWGFSFGTAMAFAMECYETGILNRSITGGLDLRFGSAEASLEALRPDLLAALPRDYYDGNTLRYRANLTALFSCTPSARTAAMTAAILPPSVRVSGAFALAAARSRSRFTVVLRAFSLLPIITPPFVVGMAIILLFPQLSLWLPALV
jgi:ABC-type sugar transport system permease subunit